MGIRLSQDGPVRTVKSILGLALAACMQAAGAQSDREPEYLLDAPGHIAWEAGGLYQGRFSDGTRFQIELAYPEPAGAQPADAPPVMDNAYWYPRHYTGQVMRLSAAPADGKAIALAFAPVPDGPAQERFVLTLGPDRLSGKGSWTSTASGKQLTFALTRAVLYRAVALTRPSPEAQEEGVDRPFTFSALFPVFQDRALAAWVRSSVGSCSGSLDCRNEVKVRWYSKQLLSLDASEWLYHLGAAHGNYGSTMRHYALGGATPLHVRFTNFVPARTACRNKVSAAIETKLRAQDMSWAEQGVLTEFTEPKFIATPKGIEFHWDPYEVGSYAQGAPSVFLTRAELGSCAVNLPRYD